MLDTSGPPLRGALTARPHMVKVNLAELEAALPLPRGRDQNTIVCKMGKLVRGGIPVVAVSLGSQGVLVLRRGDVVAVRGRVDLG